jgi:hypothetical protein
LYADDMSTSPDLPLQRELDTFEAHRAELLAASAGRYALVHGDQVAGVFDNEHDGISEGYRSFGNVPFLVKKIEPVDLPVYMPIALLVRPRHMVVYYRPCAWLHVVRAGSSAARTWAANLFDCSSDRHGRWASFC